MKLVVAVSIAFVMLIGVTGCGSDDDVAVESRVKNVAPEQPEAFGASDAPSKADCDLLYRLDLSDLRDLLDLYGHLDLLDLDGHLDRRDSDNSDGRLDFLDLLDLLTRLELGDPHLDRSGRLYLDDLLNNRGLLELRDLLDLDVITRLDLLDVINRLDILYRDGRLDDLSDDLSDLVEVLDDLDDLRYQCDSPWKTGNYAPEGDDDNDTESKNVPASDDVDKS